MKILYLITKSEAGGAQTHILQLSKALSKKGNSVVIMSFPGGWLEGEAEKIGVKFYDNKYFSNNLNLFFIIKSMKRIQEVINDFQPDLISCHSTIAGLLGRAVIRNKIPTIFTAHGWGFTQGTSSARARIIVLLEKIASNFCSKIICVSNFDKKIAIKNNITSSDKLITIHNGVRVQGDISLSKKKIIYPLKVVFVGRLVKQKDPMLLLRAYNRLEAGLKKKSEILIIGEGDKRKKLESFIKKHNLNEKVRLLGALPREKVFDVLKKSNIFVLTSNWEGFPRSILEAMSCGLPVIASNVGGVQESVSEDCGFIVEKGDVGAVQLSLERLIRNLKLVRVMGQNAQKKLRDNFSLEKMLHRTEEIYKSV